MKMKWRANPLFFLSFLISVQCLEEKKKKKSGLALHVIFHGFPRRFVA